MDNHRIEAVIFDLGGVLIDFDHTIAAKRIARLSDKTPEEIFNLFFDSQLTGLFEEGKISSSEFFLRLKGMLNLKINFEEFLPAWNEIFFLSEKNRAVYDLAKVLKPNYKLALLSNINILHFEYIKEKFPLFDAFHHVITSFELGLRKPHPLIYQKALEILKVPCAPCVFYTDDRPELVREAQGLGIKGVVFEGVAQLKRSLADAGININ